MTNCFFDVYSNIFPLAKFLKPSYCITAPVFFVVLVRGFNAGKTTAQSLHRKNCKPWVKLLDPVQRQSFLFDIIYRTHTDLAIRTDLVYLRPMPLVVISKLRTACVSHLQAQKPQVIFTQRLVKMFNFV